MEELKKFYEERIEVQEKYINDNKRKDVISRSTQTIEYRVSFGTQTYNLLGPSVGLQVDVGPPTILVSDHLA